MLNNTLDQIYQSNAKFARDVEYLKETANDDIIDERMEVAESKFTVEKSVELVEAANMLKEMKIDDEYVNESTEIERILNSKEDLTFNEMVGIE